MNKKIVISLALTALLFSPMLAFAIDPGNPPVGNPNLDSTGIVNAILGFVWPLFIGFAVIMLLVAGFLFLSANGDPGKIGTARMAVLWAVIGIVVGVLAFSIPFVIRNTLNI